MISVAFLLMYHMPFISLSKPKYGGSGNPHALVSMSQKFPGSLKAVEIEWCYLISN